MNRRVAIAKDQSKQIQQLQQAVLSQRSLLLSERSISGDSDSSFFLSKKSFLMEAPYMQNPVASVPDSLRQLLEEEEEPQLETEATSTYTAHHDDHECGEEDICQRITLELSEISEDDVMGVEPASEVDEKLR